LDDKVLGLDLGADQYITKPFTGRTLMARVRAVLRGAGVAPDNSIQPEILSFGSLRMDVERHEMTVAGLTVHLPPKEFELARMLLSRAGKLITRERLLEEVWGPGYYGHTRTLDVHITRLRSKFKDAGRITTVRGVGYRFDP
jgi:two-component system, OmpR family, response regulator RegX3